MPGHKENDQVIEPRTREEIDVLVTEHAWLIDHGCADELVRLYTHDGELIGLPPADLIGQEEIAAWGDTRAQVRDRTSRHVQTNLRLAWENNVLTGTVLYTMYRASVPEHGDTIPFSVGEYHDEYSRVDGKWLIRRRVIHRVFSRPNI